MKIIRYLALAVLPLMFFSCDNFEENEYIVYPQGETNETTPITKNQTSQAVLLEDYTGWKCVNCPAAAALLTELQSKYGESLVAMSVHASSFASPSKANNNLDLRTEYGEKWNNEFGLSGYPVGVINRLNNGASASKAVQKDDWDNKIESILSSTEHLMNLNLGAEKQSEDFLVSVQCAVLKNIDFRTLISVVVLEDGIVGVQLNSDASNPQINDYVFNHVLRTNGIIDYSLFASATANQTIQKNYKINIDPSWNTDNCKILVFVTNADNGEVIQSNEIKIK